MFIRLDNWYLRDDKRLGGDVYGHPDHNDGEHIKTSSIADLDIIHFCAITRSGTHYYLGRPRQEFVSFVEKEGFPSSKLIRERLNVKALRPVRG